MLKRMRAFHVFASIACAACVGIACGSGVPDYPLLIDVCDGGWCPPAGATTTTTTGATTSSSSTSSSTSGAGGGVATSELKGTVDRITAPNFGDTGNMYTGTATLAIYPAVGSEIDVPFGGTSGTTFDAKGVA